MFGGGEKGEACTVAFANQPLDLCLLEEGEEPRRIPEICGDNVLEGGRQGGLVVWSLTCCSAPVVPSGMGAVAWRGVVTRAASVGGAGCWC